MTKIRFEEPPKATRGRAWDYTEIAQELENNPGAWGIVSEDNKSPRGASSLKSRGFDVTIRKKDDLFTVYARYVPSEETE